VKRAYVAIGLLACLSGYLTYRVWDLKKQTYRAEYFMQSGMLSAQRACQPTVDALRRAPILTPELHAFAFACYGNYGGSAEAREIDLLFSSSSSPTQIADAIEERLKKSKRLPWTVPGPVEASELPVQYRDGTAIH
jgi:hypothetical protein